MLRRHCSARQGLLTHNMAEEEPLQILQVTPDLTGGQVGKAYWGACAWSWAARGSRDVQLNRDQPALEGLGLSSKLHVLLHHPAVGFLVLTHRDKRGQTVTSRHIPEFRISGQFGS